MEIQQMKLMNNLPNNLQEDTANSECLSYSTINFRIWNILKSLMNFTISEIMW